MASKTGIEFVLELTDKFSDPLKGATGSLERFEKDLGGMDSKVKKATGGWGKHMQTFKGGIKDAASQIPGLGGAMTALASPVGMVAAGIGAVGFAAKEAVQSANAFEDAMLPLRQLNMDKSKAEMDAYGQSILKASDITGYANTEMTNAFYDLQSATGLFGPEVEEIVTRVGQFSQATGADLQSSIAGAAKAMNAFGFGADKMDEFLKSNIATVQLGVTTFDELASVQVEYAGSAAAANQTVDEANKLFAAFTSASKDSATAATMTKAAFQGMTQKAFIDGVGKIGVNVFDASGKMRQMSEIVGELQPKIAKMSDEEFSTLRNNIGGPEGLQNMLNTIKSQGDTLIGTFDKFDETVNTTDIDAMIESANGNVTKLWGLVKNKVNNIFTRLGQKILPVIVKALHWVNEVVDRITGSAEEGGGMFSMWIDHIKRIWEATQPLREVLARIVGLVWDVVSGITKWIYKSKAFNLVWDGITLVIKGIADYIMFVIDMWTGAFKQIERMANWVSDKVEKLANKVSNAANKLTFGLVGTSDEERASQNAQSYANMQEGMALGKQFFAATFEQQKKMLEGMQGLTPEQDAMIANLINVNKKMLGDDTAFTQSNIEQFLKGVDDSGAGGGGASPIAGMPGMGEGSANLGGGGNVDIAGAEKAAQQKHITVTTNIETLAHIENHVAAGGSLDLEEMGERVGEIFLRHLNNATARVRPA